MGEPVHLSASKSHSHLFVSSSASGESLTFSTYMCAPSNAVSVVKATVTSPTAVYFRNRLKKSRVNIVCDAKLSLR